MDKELLRIMTIKAFMAAGLSDEKAMLIVKSFEDRQERRQEAKRSLKSVYWDSDNYWRVTWQRTSR